MMLRFLHLESDLEKSLKNSYWKEHLYLGKDWILAQG